MIVIISPGHVEANGINTSKVLAHSKHSKNKNVLCERNSKCLKKKERLCIELPMQAGSVSEFWQGEQCGEQDPVGLLL